MECKQEDKELPLKPVRHTDYATARAQKLYLQASICDWTGIERDRKLISRLGVSGEHVPPFSMLFLEDNPAGHLKRSELYARKKFRQTPL